MSATPSFASLNADPTKGFRSVPRWFRATDFWKSLPAAHRSVLDELYHRMAHSPLTQKGSGIALKRGEWAMSWEALAKASGASVQQARAAVGKAVANHIVQQRSVSFRTPTSTSARCVFTWLDFDLYDTLNVSTNSTLNNAPNSTLNTALNSTPNSIRTLLPTTQAVTTLPHDTNLTTQGGGNASLLPRDGENEAMGSYSPADDDADDSDGYPASSYLPIAALPSVNAPVLPVSTTSVDALMERYKARVAAVLGQAPRVWNEDKLRKTITDVQLTGRNVTTLIDVVTLRWTELCAATAWMADPIKLNEFTLKHSEVLKLADNLAQGFNAVPDRWEEDMDDNERREWQQLCEQMGW